MTDERGSDATPAVTFSDSEWAEQQGGRGAANHDRPELYGADKPSVGTGDKGEFVERRCIAAQAIGRP